jgi:uncharacterized membrane protein YczE
LGLVIFAALLAGLAISFLYSFRPRAGALVFRAIVWLGVILLALGVAAVCRNLAELG